MVRVPEEKSKDGRVRKINVANLPKISVQSDDLVGRYKEDPIKTKLSRTSSYRWPSENQNAQEQEMSMPVSV